MILFINVMLFFNMMLFIDTILELLFRGWSRIFEVEFLTTAGNACDRVAKNRIPFLQPFENQPIPFRKGVHIFRFLNAKDSIFPLNRKLVSIGVSIIIYGVVL